MNTKTTKTRAFINYGMQTNASNGNIAKTIPECMKNALLRASCKCAYNVVKTCRQYSGGKQWETLTNIMLEIALFSKYGTCENGDGIQLVWEVYETVTNCIEIDVTASKMTNALVNILYPFETASDKLHDEMMQAYMTEKRAVPYISERVVIKKADSAKIGEIDISPRQIAARKAREYVNSHCAPDTRGQTAVYLDAMTETEIDGLTYAERIYYRIDDAENDAPTMETVENQTEMYDIIAQLQLTATQADILRLRIKGYGNKAIATYRGKSKQAVMKTLAQIAEKARKCGLLGVTETDTNELQFSIELEKMKDERNNEKRVKSYETPRIEILDIETALNRYEKTAKQREIHADTIKTGLAIKSNKARRIADENARICDENAAKYRKYHEFYQVEHDAEQLAMYAQR